MRPDAYGLRLAAQFQKYRVETTLKRNGLMDVQVNDMIGIPNPYNYRNKEIKFIQGEKGRGRVLQTKSHAW